MGNPVDLGSPGCCIRHHGAADLGLQLSGRQGQLGGGSATMIGRGSPAMRTARSIVVHWAVLCAGVELLAHEKLAPPRAGTMPPQSGGLGDFNYDAVVQLRPPVVARDGTVELRCFARCTSGFG